MSIFNCRKAQHAELVLKNGVIYTVDGAMSTAQAVAIAGGKFIAVGSNAEVERYVGAGTKVLDLGGKTVTPGFIDSHYHFMGVGKRDYYLNLDGTKSMREFLSKVRQEVRKKAKGERVIGRGWIEEDWPSKRFPTRRDLDRVAPDNPVLLTRADGHAIVANTLALRLAGVDRTTPAPLGGAILKDAQGNCNGLLLDNAMTLLFQHVPPDTSEQMRREYALTAQREALAYGLTQIHDMGSGWGRVALWKKMYASGDLRMRIYSYIRGPGADSDSLLESGLEKGLFDDRFSVGGIKITEDGALGSRGAALLKKYSDADTKGFLLHSDDEVYPTIKKAAERGMQMVIHAIGDAANRKVLDLYEKAFAETGKDGEDLRFRIEHSQIVDLADIPRFKQLGVIPSMQPSHAIGDLHFAIRRLGMKRMNEGYAWRKFLDQGNFIPAGSDAPVEEGNPMIEFYAAVARKDTTGFSAEGWFPEYRMTREEALKSLTIWGARAVFMEDKIGSIEPGKYADFVVLDRDLMTDPEERLFDIKALMTFVAGERVFARDEKMQVGAGAVSSAD